MTAKGRCLVLNYGDHAENIAKNRPKAVAKRDDDAANAIGYAGFEPLAARTERAYSGKN